MVCVTLCTRETEERRGYEKLATEVTAEVRWPVKGEKEKKTDLCGSAVAKVMIEPCVPLRLAASVAVSQRPAATARVNSYASVSSTSLGTVNRSSLGTVNRSSLANIASVG